MKKMLLALTSVLLLTSCEELTGTLEVFSPFKANVKNKCDWNPFVTCPEMKQIEVYPGSYQAEMEVFSKSELRLQLKSKNFKETVIFSKPKYFNIPDNGRFDLTSVDINQNFALQGEVTTHKFESERRSGYESCYYTVVDTVCSPTHQGGLVCGPVSRQVWGQQFVVYYVLTTQKNIFANFINTNNEHLAKLNGQREDSEKIYLSRGFCH